MKSLFIKGTNKQYSIREDGQVIMHYKRTWANNITYTNCNKPIKIYNNGTVNLRYENSSKNIGISISILLREYFNFCYCKQCNNRVYKSKFNDSKCKDCISKNESIYNKQNRFKYIETKRRCDREYLEKMGDGYIASLLYKPVKLLSKDIIKTKRLQILLHRQLKTINL